MSELNINITKNNINSQNLKMSVLSDTNTKGHKKNSNVSSRFHKLASDFLEQRLHPKKKSWTKDLLLELANKPNSFRSVNDLGKSTQLNSVAYPILAKLHRQGLVEVKTVSG